MEKDIIGIILTYLKTETSIPDSNEFAAINQVDHLTLVGNLKSLNSFNYVELNQLEKQKWALTKEGLDYVANGTPEYRLFNLIPLEGVPKDQLQKQHEQIFQFGFQNGMKNKWFHLDKNILKRSAENIVDKDKVILLDVQEGKEPTKEIMDILKKRKLIEKIVLKYYEVKKGPNFKPIFETGATDLDTKMIATESWKTKAFKPYNFKALGKEIPAGNLNPLLKVRTKFREVLLEMGFEEMPTDHYVDTSFWNFDSLFIPQSHPARDLQDTFFIADPKEGKKNYPEYWDRVRKMHEEGGQGSIGWRYNWSEPEAKKNIFRTHTTDASVRMLFKIGQEKEFRPRKFFSIDRVFRNENLDATHLAEFHQIEGVVVDRNIGLAQLKGILREFYAKIGINELWFKPTYNPYTEPSMEVYGYHPILKRKVEIGNSGVFRPEMLLPMGLPNDVSVIAWGLSLERPTMIQYGVANIRDLIGPKLSIKYLRENPICCLKQVEKLEKKKQE